GATRPSAYTGLVYRSRYTGRDGRSSSMPPTERPIRAVFFDAGNTLLRMNYAVIAAELLGHGVRVAPEEVQRAEWRARVRLDDEVLARSRPGASTESRASADRYLRYVLEELGVADAATMDKVAE